MSADDDELRRQMRVLLWPFAAIAALGIGVLAGCGSATTQHPSIHVAPTKAPTAQTTGGACVARAKDGSYSFVACSK